jgi:hypothetical protein
VQLLIDGPIYILGITIDWSVQVKANRLCIWNSNIIDLMNDKHVKKVRNSQGKFEVRNVKHQL